MIKVGVTGGIGSGKSLVCSMFECMGIPTYNSDLRAKQLMHSPTVSEKVIQLLGKDSYINGSLNKQYVSSKIFSNKELLEGINSIVHPAVAIDYKKWLSTHSEAPYTIKESALIFETGIQDSLDKVISVYCPRDKRIERIIRRDASTHDKIKQRIKNQSSDYLKFKLSNYIVFNDEETALIPQIIRIHKLLTIK